jgi:AAA domain/DnaB-like helicase N terminal domain
VKTPNLDRSPPQALDAEQAVLGCLMLDDTGEALPAVLEVLSGDDFYLKPHGAIYEAILRLAHGGEPADVLTVAEELDRTGRLDFAGGRPYLLACQAKVPATTRAPAYARRVREAKTRRDLITRAGELIGAAYNGRELESLAAEAVGLVELATAGPDGARQQPITADALERMELAPPTWAVPGVIVQGLTIVAGKPKRGKSYLMLGLCLAVASGGLAMGKTRVAAGEVLYLALEDPLWRLQERIRQLNGGLPFPPALSLDTRWPRLAEGGKKEILHWLAAKANPRLVVIDTLEKIRSARDPKAQIYAEDYAAIGAIKQVADSRGVPVVVVHHMNKLNADDPMDSVSGSSGLTGAADSVIAFQRTGFQPEANLWIVGRDLEGSELTIRWDDHAGWILLGPRAEYERTKEEGQILEALGEAGRSMTSPELGKLLGITRDTARQRCCRMVARGLLTSENGWFTPIGGFASTNEPEAVTTVTTEKGCHSVTESQSQAPTYHRRPLGPKLSP